MKKKISVSMLTIVIGIVFIACKKETVQPEKQGASETIIQENKEISETTQKEIHNGYSFPEFYNQENDKVSFHTEIIINEKIVQEGLYHTMATLQEKDYDKAFLQLFSNIEVIENFEFELTDENRKKGKEVFFQGSNFESLHMTPTTLFYAQPIWQNIVNVFSLEKGNYNANLYSSDLEFEFASQEEAFELIKKTLEQIGLSVDGNYECYALDFNTMMEQEYAVDKDGKENKKVYKERWSEEDNGYFFSVHQTLQNCKVQYPIADVFVEPTASNAPLKIYYTKNGIEMLEIDRIFSFNVGNKWLELKSFENVAQTLSNKYEMLLTESTYNVIKAELYMRPVKLDKDKYEVNPVWEITIIEQLSSGESKMYINAVTGEEVL